MEASTEYGEAGERTGAHEFLMPAPTILPLLLAGGLLIVFAGFIFSSLLVYLGLAITLCSAVGWWRQVIPVEAHEAVRLDVGHRPEPIAVTQRAVARLQVGDAQHRVHIPEEAHSYSSGVVGGLAGGAAMAVVACVYGLIAQHSIWFPINLLSGVVLPAMGDATLAQLQAFDGVAFAAAVVGHLGLSILVGVLYAVTLPMFPKYAFVWAGILMPLMWSALVATLLALINPALNERISWPWFVACQLVFGLVCGYIVARSARIKTMQSWSFAKRANVEAHGHPRDHREREDK